MTLKNAKITGQALYGFALLALFIVLLMLSGGSGFAAEACGETEDECIQFETLRTNATTGAYRLDEAYTTAIYEFSLTGGGDREVHIKHRISSVARFTNATTTTIKLKDGKWWNHRVVLNNDGVQEAKIQCVSGCGSGQTITTRGTYIK